MVLGNRKIYSHKKNKQLANDLLNNLANTKESLLPKKLAEIKPVFL
jgi:hypothetical protein